VSGRVAVVGSANVDLVYRVDRLPTPGETVTAGALSIFPGGKGLNQAVAASRAGAQTSFVAAVGRDSHSGTVLGAIAQENIDADQVRVVNAATGTAVVTLDAKGENSIVILPAANAELTELTEADRALISSCAVLVCQLEVPDSVIVEAVTTAHAAGTIVILNPAPVRAVSRSLLDLVDVLILNEHEARQLHARQPTVRCVVTTLGSKGAVLEQRGENALSIAPRRTTAVDTTGAGDTFVGTFAAEVAAGTTYEAAARRATVAASLSVEVRGAVPSIPTRKAVDDALHLERVEIT
jgi:ribokinase